MKRSVAAEKIWVTTDEDNALFRFKPCLRRSRKRPSESKSNKDRTSTYEERNYSKRGNLPPNQSHSGQENDWSSPTPQGNEAEHDHENIIIETTAEDKHYAYARQLDEADAITLTADSVVMRDVDLITMSLKQCQYCIVFVYNTFLCCSCNPHRTNFIARMKNLATSVLTDEYAGCIHIEVAAMARDSHDEVELAPPFIETHKDFPVLTSLATQGHILVQTEKFDFGVILPRAGKLICGVCSNGCAHHKVPVEAALKDEEEITSDLQWLLSNTEEVKVSLPSIQTTKPIGLQGRLTTRLCDCDTPPSVTSTDVLVYSVKGAEVTRCALLKCEHCNECDVDADVALLNNYAVDNKVLREYLHLFCTNALSLYGFYKTICWRIYDNTRTNPTLQYIHLRTAWISFVDHLDYDTEGTFTCDLCKSQPSLVVGDGIALSFQRRFRGRNTEDAGREANHNNVINSGLSHSELVFIDNKPTRQMLSQWVDEDQEGEVIEQLHLLLNRNRPELLEAVTSTRCPDELQLLIKQLAKASPVTALCEISALPLLTQLVEDQQMTPDDLKLLAQKSPFLFHVWSDGLHRVAWVRDCILILLEKLQAVQIFRPHASYHYHIKDDGYFPHMPVIRRRGEYTLDRQAGETLCTKNASGHSSLLPGLFTLHCKHSICVGYSIMERHESPNTPFTILKTRFEKAPSVVIYDNACNLEAYCLKRDPGYFKDTKFLIDRFHYRNHTACSMGYNIDNYPQHKDVNTQVAEQSNSCIYRLRGMLSYANQANFNKYLRLFLGFRNSISRARHSMDTAYPELFRMMAAKFKV